MTAVKLEQTTSPDHRLISPVTLSPKPKGYHFSLYTLNREEMLTPFKTQEARLRQLRLHGILVPGYTAGKRFVRQYIVGVFQCKSLFTYVSNDKTVWLAEGKAQVPERFRLIRRSEKNREARKMERLAVRSLYALGWDYGVVRLAKGVRGQSIVLDAIARPKLNSHMEKAFQHAFSEYSVQLSQGLQPSQVLLGADPEFILIDSHGRLKMASDYFTRRGFVGCDAIWRGRDRTRKPLVEIRPRPSHTPRDLVIRLYRGMLYAAKRINNSQIKWLAGALPYPGLPIGGHIHFSGVPLGSAILRSLDNYLALPLVLVEDERGVKRRPKYGFLGDFREKYHGGFEYRTPPSWLISPTLTKGIFSLARVIAFNYPYLTQFPLEDVTVQKAYYNGDKDVIKKFIPSLWNELIMFPEYDEEQANLDAYYDYIMSGRTWDESEDIRKKWRIPPYGKGF